MLRFSSMLRRVIRVTICVSVHGLGRTYELAELTDLAPVEDSDTLFVFGYSKFCIKNDKLNMNPKFVGSSDPVH